MISASEQDFLLELEDPASRLHYGVNALRLMVSGLEQEEDPYADGLYALWCYLQEAEDALHTALSAVP